MKSFTGTKEFVDLPRGDNLLIIKGATEANPVTIEYPLDNDWVTADKFTTDGVRIVWLTCQRFRIVGGSASYAIA